MLDIVEINEGEDLVIRDTIVAKAANVLSVQQAALEYAQSFGVDFKFFIQSELQFQNESFKAYLIKRLTEHQVDVSKVTEIVNTLTETIVYEVGSGTRNVKGLIR